MSETSPLAEAIELLVDARRRSIDLTGAAARRAASHMFASGYAGGSAAAASDLSGIAAGILSAAFGELFALGDALAVMADPPQTDAMFNVALNTDDLPDDGAPFYVYVNPDSIIWEFHLTAEPDPLPTVIPLQPPVVDNTVTVRLRPGPMIPACTIEMSVVPLDGRPARTSIYPLDVTTQVTE